MSLKDQRQALVDTFINAIYLYDDKVLITFNYKEGTQTVTFGKRQKPHQREMVRIWIALLHHKKNQYTMCTGFSFSVRKRT
ncbi:MAG: hypothetical protein V8R88_03530 [Faecalibacterium prausnitzii]